MRNGIMAALACSLVTAAAQAQPLTPAERGKQALFTRSFVPSLWPRHAYDNAWKFWNGNLQQKPDNYDATFRERYGLHVAPFENGHLPMGIRTTSTLLGGKGLAIDCLMCHAGPILDKTYIGLGNSVLDVQALVSELGQAGGGSGKTPFAFSRMRGTSEAGALVVFLMSYREPDLKVRSTPYDLDLRDDMVEKVPAWWLLKKKKTMYYTGSTHARSVRSLMQFLLPPLNSTATFEREEQTFRDIQAYLLSLEAPKYPYPIDHDLANKGETLFGKNCSKCHGSYGPNASYPNKIVHIDEIGTDRKRFEGLSRKFGEHYLKSWFAKETNIDLVFAEPIGYQAPPLDGVWATAPYLHNGSVPTLYHMLNSYARPKIYTRSFRTDAEAYDNVNVGWKFKELDQPPSADMSAFERRRIYDTSHPGQGNGGHIFGDHLTDEQRRAVIEYLKTL